MTRDPSIQRVLQLHTRYRLAGGEDQVVDAEKRLLEAAGIQVSQVIFDNADLQESRSLVGDLRLAGSAIWSRAAARRVQASIVAERPQVVHVHNTFPAASPSVYAAAAAHEVPVVQTLHNYRFVCPAATAFRNGHVCTDCVGRSFPWPAVAHACVRDSRAQSLVAVATTSVHRTRGTFTRGIHGYIALTSFQRDLMIRGGFQAEGIRVIPNFLEPDPGLGREIRAGVLFVGRLSREKGIASLLDAAAFVPGVIGLVGSGPLEPLAQQANAAGHVVFHGALTRSSVVDELRRTIALVLPSVWYEGFPLVLLEAFATGTPVIASRIGSLGELVEDGVTGLMADPGNAADLAARIRWATTHPDKMRRMGLNGRRMYEARFRGQTHLDALREAYASTGMDRPVGRAT